MSHPLCTCGEPFEEHGNDPDHPGSTACTAEHCDCIAYEAEPPDEPEVKRKLPRSPSAIERRALEVLAKRPSPASIVGAVVWTDRKGHVISSNGGGDYGAQMLLGRMRKQNWCRVQHGDGQVTSIWEITAAGLAALAAPPVRLTERQASVLAALAVYQRNYYKPIAAEIQDGCFAGGSEGWTTEAVAEAIGLWRQITSATYIRRTVPRGLESLVKLGLVARVFRSDEPEPLYVITSDGCDEHRRRNPDRT